MSATSPAIDRIMRRSVQVGSCRVWTGCLTPEGYGQISWKNKRWLVHRAIWTELRGPIPAGLTIDHVKARGCRHRACVNVDHMEVVTSGENSLRAESPPTANSRKERCPKCQGEYGRDRRGRRRCEPCRWANRLATGETAGTGRLADHNRRKTRCPQGHPYDNANTYVSKAGSRMCRHCMRTRARARAKGAAR